MTITLAALFGAGLLTFLSPCILPLVPLYLSMLAGVSVAALREGGNSRPRPVLAALAFSGGLSLVLVVLGISASLAARALSTHRLLIMQLAGVAVVLAGLKVSGLIQIPALDREARPFLSAVKRGTGLLWPFLLGAGFALGWTPCAGPVLGSALAFTAGSGVPWTTAAAHLGSFALGLSLPLVLAALAAPWALRLMSSARRAMRAFEVVTGAALAIVGLLMVTDHLGATLRTANVAHAAPPVAPTCGLEPGGASGVFRGSGASTDVTGRPVMLEFVSPDCPICRAMAPVVADAERDCATHQVSISRIDVSTAEGRRAAGEHGVLGVPTFVFLDSGGREVARLVGRQSLANLEQSLEILAGQRCDGFARLPAAGNGS